MKIWNIYIYDFESFWYVAFVAFENKNDEEMEDYEDYTDYDNFLTREGNYPPIAFLWEEEKPETMQAICPQLYAKFWN